MLFVGALSQFPVHERGLKSASSQKLEPLNHLENLQALTLAYNVILQMLPAKLPSRVSSFTPLLRLASQEVSRHSLPAP